MKVLCDSSSLIALEQIGRLGLLQSLFEELLITPAVAKEVSGSVRLFSWLLVTEPPELASRVLQRTLGPGESETIALAVEMRPDFVILDDKAARRVATGLGLPVIGTVGILLKAREKGLIPALRPLLDRLREASFHISPSLLRAALLAAGEI
jgi:hypothetical protein